MMSLSPKPVDEAQMHTSLKIRYWLEKGGLKWTEIMHGIAKKVNKLNLKYAQNMTQMVWIQKIDPK